MADKDGTQIWTIIKTVLMTAGFIYLVSLFTWFAHWAVILAAVAGVGFLGYKIASALKTEKPEQKLLTSEPTFDQQLADLEREERLLDSKIGIR